MVLGRVNQEIRLRLAFAGQLWPDARIVGHEGMIGQARPVVADARIERVGAAGIDVVVLLLDPFDIGPEACGPAKIQREVSPQPAGDGVSGSS